MLINEINFMMEGVGTCKKELQIGMELKGKGFVMAESFAWVMILMLVNKLMPSIPA